MKQKIHKKTCSNLNQFEKILLSISAASDCVLIFTFGSLVVIPVGITSSAFGLKSCAVTRRIKK